MFVWIPWRQHVGKLPDPAAAVPLSDYRSEQLHAVELARSKTPTDTNTQTHPRTYTQACNTTLG